MKTTAWRWLVLLLIPGCILVQPLDEAKPADSDDSSSGGPAKAGSGNGSGGAPSKAGSGNSGAPAKAGSGNAGRAGSSAGGAPSGVDFSLFTGNWKLVGGTITTTCEGSAPSTAPAETGTVDKVGLGTTSDLIFGPGANCEILADVEDRSAFLNSGTLPCSESDGTYNYYSTTDYFEFAVSDDEQTAGAAITTSVVVTDLSDNPLRNCQLEQSLDYQR